MKIIVGLGNPGEQYDKTRHNLGFMVLDELLKKFEPLEKTFWDPVRDTQGKEDNKFKAVVKKIKIGKEEYLLVKPLTFMNNSGFAVSKILSYYKVNLEDMTLIHDDLDLPVGKIRVRFGGGAGGHNGVESVIERVGDDKFLRIRLGIGDSRKIEGEYKMKNMDNYVLSNFGSNERSKVKSMTKEAIKTIELISEHGIEKYMSKYNS